MPYHSGVWRPVREGPIHHGSTVVLKFGESGKVEGTAEGPRICVRVNGSIRVVDKKDIVDVPPSWENDR